MLVKLVIFSVILFLSQILVKGLIHIKGSACIDERLIERKLESQKGNKPREL